MSRIEESISKLKRFKYHAIGRLELEDAIDNVVSWYEHMLKGAVEGFIFQSEDYYPKELIARYNGELKHGDKVRIIVVKAEEE